MSTTISLNRQALHALIDSDPEFELSLKAAVVSEVARRFFEKDAAKVIAAAEPELFKRALEALQEDTDTRGKVQRALENSLLKRDGGWYDRMKLSPKVRKEIEDAVEDIREREIRKATIQTGSQVAASVNEALAKALELVDIEERIKKRVNRLTEEHIAKQVQIRFDERMAKLRAAAAETD